MVDDELLRDVRQNRNHPIQPNDNPENNEEERIVIRGAHRGGQQQRERNIDGFLAWLGRHAGIIVPTIVMTVVLGGFGTGFYYAIKADRKPRISNTQSLEDTRGSDTEKYGSAFSNEEKEKTRIPFNNIIGPDTTIKNLAAARQFEDTKSSSRPDLEIEKIDRDLRFYRFKDNPDTETSKEVGKCETVKEKDIDGCYKKYKTLEVECEQTRGKTKKSENKALEKCLGDNWDDKQWKKCYRESGVEKRSHEAISSCMEDYREISKLCTDKHWKTFYDCRDAAYKQGFEKLEARLKNPPNKQ
jgi:hypothetical protein